MPFHANNNEVTAWVTSRDGDFSSQSNQWLSIFEVEHGMHIITLWLESSQYYTSVQTPSMQISGSSVQTNSNWNRVSFYSMPTILRVTSHSRHDRILNASCFESNCNCSVAPLRHDSIRSNVELNQTYIVMWLEFICEWGRLPYFWPVLIVV
jgi:hypothetical protein